MSCSLPLSLLCLLYPRVSSLGILHAAPHPQRAGRGTPLPSPPPPPLPPPSLSVLLCDVHISSSLNAQSEVPLLPPSHLVFSSLVKINSLICSSSSLSLARPSALSSTGGELDGEEEMSERGGPVITGFSSRPSHVRTESQWLSPSSSSSSPRSSPLLCLTRGLFPLFLRVAITPAGRAPHRLLGAFILSALHLSFYLPSAPLKSDSSLVFSSSIGGRVRNPPKQPPPPPPPRAPSLTDLCCCCR